MMNDDTAINAGDLGGELADVVRRTNAEHRRAGSPQSERIDQLWINLRNEIAQTVAAGDTPAGRRAIARWECLVLGEIRALANGRLAGGTR